MLPGETEPNQANISHTSKSTTDLSQRRFFGIFHSLLTQPNMEVLPNKWNDGNLLVIMYNVPAFSIRIRFPLPTAHSIGERRCNSTKWNS